jgi:hypothetical protein
LWHLSALVAVVAAVMAFAVHRPDLVLPFSIIVLSLVPAALGAEQYLRRFQSPDLPPPDRATRIISRVVWTFIFFVLFSPVYIVTFLIIAVAFGALD